MPGIDFGAVRQAVPLTRTAELLGLTLRPHSREWLEGPCPLRCCPSRRCCGYCPGSNKWACRACQEHGDVIDLWATVRGIGSLHDAARDLCEHAGVAVPWRARRSRNRHAPPAPPNREEGR